MGPSWEAKTSQDRPRQRKTREAKGKEKEGKGLQGKGVEKYGGDDFSAEGGWFTRPLGGDIYTKTLVEHHSITGIWKRREWHDVKVSFT